MKLPRWKCHKEVGAFKIAIIDFSGPDGALLVGKDYTYAVRVGREYFRKHRPEVGGYYVAYKGGYESFSPAQDFEDGYTPIA